MSWFSRAFSMPEEDEDERKRGEESEDEEEEEETDSLNLAEIASATGASIKEDFSNLRKTFTRQLWGVASFIAPPPPSGQSSTAQGGGAEDGRGGETSQEQLLVFQQQEGNDEEVRGSGVAAASEIESRVGQVEEFIPQNLGLLQSSTTASTEPTSGGAFFAPEESDPQWMVPPGHYNKVIDNVVSSGENQGFERPKLTGLRSDFAELRGTVATGISRITSVLREVTGEDDEDVEKKQSPLVSGRESPHHPLSSPVVGERQGVNSPRHSFDAFLKPLFGNMLMRGKSSFIEGDMDPADDEGAERGSYSRDSPRGKVESTYGELDSLPSAIASGLGGISKFASSLLQIVTDESDEDHDDGEEDENLAFGLTEPVVTFARNIATHPETWLDFPLPENDDDDDDFELTNAQKNHIRALELAAPGLQALKIELCPNYMTEEHFWKIYFVLMHSRLSSNDALMLSTQQVVRARESMLQELQRKELRIDEVDPRLERVVSDAVDASAQDIEQAENEFGSRLSTPPTNDLAISNPPVSSPVEDTSKAGKVRNLDPSVGGSIEAAGLIQSKPDTGRFSLLRLGDESEVDEWPDEEPSPKQDDNGDPASRLDTSTLGDEDVSFSDLEDDDSLDKTTFVNEGTSLSSPKSPASSVLHSASAIPLVSRETSSSITQGDGTPRKSSEKGEFNDWFKVDQDDMASSGSSSP